MPVALEQLALSHQVAVAVVALLQQGHLHHVQGTHRRLFHAPLPRAQTAQELISKACVAHQAHALKEIVEASHIKPPLRKGAFFAPSALQRGVASLKNRRP